MAFILRFFGEEEGAGMAEYALLVALIGVLLVGSLNALRIGVEAALSGATSILTGGT